MKIYSRVLTIFLYFYRKYESLKNACEFRRIKVFHSNFPEVVVLFLTLWNNKRIKIFLLTKTWLILLHSIKWCLFFRWFQDIETRVFLLIITIGTNRRSKLKTIRLHWRKKIIIHSCNEKHIELHGKNVCEMLWKNHSFLWQLKKNGLMIRFKYTNSP